MFDVKPKLLQTILIGCQMVFIAVLVELFMKQEGSVFMHAFDANNE